MNVYISNVTVRAVFYDGSPSSFNELEEFARTAKGFDRVNKRLDGMAYVQVTTQYASVWLPVPVNSYVVKYPSNLLYPYKKTAFEKRFKLVEVKNVENSSKS